MRILAIALNDLSQIFRDWKSALFLIAMPVAFTLLIGFVFGRAGVTEDSRLSIGILDEDNGAILSTHALALLDASEAIQPVPLEGVDRAEAMKQVSDEDLAAVLVMPAGYSEQVLGRGEAVVLRPEVIVDQASNAGQAANSGIQAAMGRLAIAVQAAQFSAEVYEAQGGSTDQGFMEQALDRAMAEWQDPPLTVVTGQTGVAVESDEQQEGPTDFAHASAGIMVQFAIAGLIGAAGIVVWERKSKTMQRLLTTPVSRIEIILGHFLAMFVMVLLQLGILVAFGQLVLNVGYMQAPPATLLMMGVTALWAASLGLLIGTFARTEDQVVMFALVLMFILAGMGGAWMPLEFTSPAFQAVGHLLPSAWAIDGFENIVVRGLGLSSVLIPAAILLAYTAVFFGVAVWRFRFE